MDAGKALTEGSDRGTYDLPLPALFPGGDHDPRARLGVRIRLMMLERDLEIPADIGQFRGIDAPDSACQSHRADERVGRPGQVVRFTAGVQHPPVERGIVSSKEIGACYQLPQGRPELNEGGRIADIVPRYAMEIGEDELPVGWPDQIVLPPHDATTLHDHKPDRAGAVRTKVRGLKIDGNKGRHERGNPSLSRMIALQAGKLSSRKT